MPFSEDQRPDSTWAEGLEDWSILLFDLWDDSFDLIETCFDDFDAFPTNGFTEDTHP